MSDTTVAPTTDMDEWRDRMRAWLASDPREGDVPAPPIPSPAWAARRTLELPQSWRGDVIVEDHAQTYEGLGVTVEISQDHWFDFENGGTPTNVEKPSEPYVLVHCDFDTDLGGYLSDMERMAAAVLHAIALVKEAGL